MLNQPIYNEDGTIKNYGDNGKFVDNLNSEIDLHYLIKRFPLKDQPIAKMISEGYTRREIMKSLKVGQHRIENVLKRLQKELKLV